MHTLHYKKTIAILQKSNTSKIKSKLHWSSKKNYSLSLHVALDKVLQAEQARYTGEFAKIEKQFNDIRREHTKAVVALRQAERQVEREKDKSAEQLSLQQKEYEMKLEKSRSQLRHMEKERNMLMATVRQEGFKVPRLRPKELSG